MYKNYGLSKRETLLTQLIECCAEALPERLTLESKQDFIYLSDPITYELYLINMADPADLHPNWGNYAGRKCYEILQNRTEPCPFCTNHLLEHNIDYIWRHHNDLVKRDYILKDRLIEWNGKSVRMEIVIDISEPGRVETVLQSSMENQNILTGCLRCFISTDTMQKGCAGILEKLGIFFGAEFGTLNCVGYTPLNFQWKGENNQEWEGVIPDSISFDAMELWESKLCPGQQVILTDIENLRGRDDFLYAEMWISGVHSFCATPIFLHGNLIGFLYFINITKHWSELAVLTMIASYISAMLEKDCLEQDKLRLQYYDTLTECANFEGFKREASQLLDEYPDRKYALWYCDIKKFKYINDMFGYDVGDSLLQYWAEILRCSAASDETYGRVAGDNFIIFSRYTDVHELEDRFWDLVEQLAAFGPTAIQKYRLDVVAGIYCIEKQDDILSIDEMLNCANMAQKNVKDQVGSRIAFYNDVLRQKVVHDLQLESGMRDAIQEQAFQLYLQPQISLKEEYILHAEVLARWRRPDGSILMPGEFVDLFERDGLIVELDRYMYEHACSFLHEWQTKKRAPLCLSVNVSRVSMLQPDFVEWYCHTKEIYGLQDGMLELEFTETIVVENYERFRSIVSRLRRNGFLCAVDDFGTCQSSLNLLRNLPFDVLKLDKQFFAQDGDSERGSAVVNCVLQLAEALRMKTVAEGVETEELVHQLIQMGCDRIQGYIFFKPMEAEQYFALSDEVLRRGKKNTINPPEFC